MRSAMATAKTPTRLLLLLIPDSWAWMRPDLVIRLLPFTAAFAIAYVLSGRGRWLGVGLGNLTAQVSFAAAAVPLMFAAAVAVQVWLTRRRGALSVPAGAGDAWFQAAFYAVNGPIEEAFFRGLVQGALSVAWGGPIGFLIVTSAYGVYHRLVRWTLADASGSGLGSIALGLTYWHPPCPAWPLALPH